MIKSLSRFFDEFLTESEQKERPAHTIELATAVLMIEISLADDQIQIEERDVIKGLLNSNFNLSEDEINELIQLAEAEVDHAVSLHDFTRLLIDTLSNEERIRIIEHLWRVAYADTVLDKYEEYYIRKIADLLYIPHSDYIKAKLAAEKELS